MQIASSALQAIPFLLCSSAGQYYALPLSHVGETLRPLPIVPLPDMPSSVLGACTLRGEPVPVISLSSLSGAPAGNPTRFISLRLEGRVAALAVDDVIGVRNLPATLLEQTPPLFDGGADAQVAGISARDQELMIVLRAARIVPEAVWEALAIQTEHP